MDFIYQIIISDFKFLKYFAKFMILIALFKKFLIQQLIASIEVNNMARYYSKLAELRIITFRLLSGLPGFTC